MGELHSQEIDPEKHTHPIVIELGGPIAAAVRELLPKLEGAMSERDVVICAVSLLEQINGRNVWLLEPSDAAYQHPLEIKNLWREQNSNTA
jgi:hypothetical protein